MKEARIRLIYNDSLGRIERQAAYNGARSFAEFGVKYDFTDASNRNALKQVKFGEKLGSMVNAETPLVELKEFKHETLLERILKKDIIGIGITPRTLWTPAGGEIQMNHGVGIAGVGGVVSTFLFSRDERLRRDPQLLERAITAAVRAVVGQVFGVTNHPAGVPCMMNSTRDFVEAVVQQGLDFCHDCRVTISVGITRAMRP
jgi:hypothetical protein